MIENLNELRGFVTLAELGSFTKASARLGVSSSALSHSIKKLETELKIKLFNRTTRSLSTTDAGEQLYRQLSPLLQQIDENLHNLSHFRQSLSGTLRINGADHSFLYALWDRLLAFMQQYPDVQLELTSDMRFADIVSGRFDAGIRLGKDVEKDMIAVKISADMQMALVASPAYLTQHGTPEAVAELADHQCLAVRFANAEGLMKWEFRPPESSQITKCQPSGKLILSNNNLVQQACLSGLGIAWLPRDRVSQALNDGLLQELLPNHAISYEGYHLYYPHRRQDSPLFKALVDCLKWE